MAYNSSHEGAAQPTIATGNAAMWHPFKKAEEPKKAEEECPLDDATLLMIMERSRREVANVPFEKRMALVEELYQARLHNKPLPRPEGPEIPTSIKKRMAYLRTMSRLNRD